MVQIGHHQKEAGHNHYHNYKIYDHNYKTYYHRIEVMRYRRNITYSCLAFRIQTRLITLLLLQSIKCSSSPKTESHFPGTILIFGLCCTPRHPLSTANCHWVRCETAPATLSLCSTLGVLRRINDL